jgi:hypothetical protein
VCPNPILHRKIHGTQYDPDAQYYFNQLVGGADTSFKSILNATIRSAKVTGYFGEIDRWWLHATGLQQHARVSIVNPTSTQITEVNSPNWTQGQGYTGNSSNMYLNTNYTPSTNGVKYTVNDACMGVYVRTNMMENSVAMGVQDTLSGDKASYVIPRFTDDKAYFKMNNTFVTFTSVSNTDSRGFVQSMRDGANSLKGSRNGAQIATGAVASTGLPTIPIYILGNNSNNTLQFPSGHQIAISVAGSSRLSEAGFYNIIQQLATDLGFNV